MTQEISNKECLDNIPKLRYAKVCADFGISQIYHKTANKFNLDIIKLTTDLKYSVYAGARVLADFQKRYRHRDVDWWVRYNCGSRGDTWDKLKTKCKHCANSLSKDYNNSHKTERREYNKIYYKRDDVKQKRRIWEKSRSDNDPQIKIYKNMSRAIRALITGQYKNSKWISYVNYSIIDLRNHLENLFEEGMNWENYGRGKEKWHIDHIIPLRYKKEDGTFFLIRYVIFINYCICPFIKYIYLIK